MITKIASSWTKNADFPDEFSRFSIKMRPRSRIHEHTMSLRCIISNLRFPYGFLEPLGRGYGFFQVFLLSPLQCTVTELYKYTRGYLI
jgi:hypothetical protein